MTSNLRFARIVFESKLDHYGNHEDKIQREKRLLLRVISYDTNLSALLNRDTVKNKSIIKDYRWKFGEIIEGPDYIYGKLAKFKGHQFTTLDDSTKGFKKDILNEAYLTILYFDLKNHILAYEFVKNIGDKAPLIVVQEAINAYYQKEQEVIITPISDTRKIFDRIKSIKIITSVKLNLTPTNPNFSPSSKKMDTLLKSLNASRISIQATSSEGLNMDGGEKFLESGLALAEEGYGNAQVKGVTLIPGGGEKSVIINSINLPLSRKVALKEKAQDNIKIIRRTLVEALALIKKK